MLNLLSAQKLWGPTHPPSPPYPPLPLVTTAPPCFCVLNKLSSLSLGASTLGKGWAFFDMSSTSEYICFFFQEVGPCFLTLTHKWIRIWIHPVCDPMGDPVNKRGAFSQPRKQKSETLVDVHPLVLSFFHEP